MCHYQQSGHRCGFHKIMGGVITLGALLPLELYLTGMALRSAAYSAQTVMFVQSGLGILLFVVGILLLAKGAKHHYSNSNGGSECGGEQEKCDTCCK